ncbi:MAG: hypothetical protein LBI91_02820 [Spirochaetaceae bacterium]|jgi:hypothetical protein|nr:hypothetical protein [Spirochaetaceae bacterium]
MPAIPLIKSAVEFYRNYSDVSGLAHKIDEPIFIIAKGRVDLVVMSMENYEKDKFESGLYCELKEAETQAGTTARRHSHVEVMARLRQITGKPAGAGPSGGAPPEGERSHGL